MRAGPSDLAEFRRARERIGKHIRTTALRAAGRELFLKCEHRQVTGSFKVRGALHKILGIDATELARGMVAASAGNHGLGVAYAARIVGSRARIVVPRAAVREKVQGILEYGAEIVFSEGGYSEAEALGKAIAEREGAVWISPYNNKDIIYGQGTLGIEIAEQLPDGEGETWEVVIPVGGGGLVCGAGAALKACVPGIRIVGAQPEASPYMHAIFHRGSADGVQESPTLADGLAGDVERGSITIGLLKSAVDDMVLVSEEEIRQALVWSISEARERVEPSAAVAIAAARRRGKRRRTVALLSGGNVSSELVRQLLEENDG